MKALFLLFLLSMALLMIISGCAAPSQELTASVVEVANQVEAKSRGEESWVPAFLDMKIFPEGQVQTFDRATAMLKLEEALVRIAPDSLFTLRDYRLQDQDRSTRLSLKLGRVWVQMTREIVGDSIFELETPTVVVAVRNTRFSVAVLADRTTVVSVLEGRVLVSLVGTEIVIEVKEGEELRIPPGGPLGQPQPISIDEIQLWEQFAQGNDLLLAPDALTPPPSPTSPPASTTKAGLTPEPTAAPTATPAPTSTPSPTPTFAPTATPTAVPIPPTVSLAGTPDAGLATLKVTWTAIAEDTAPGRVVSYEWDFDGDGVTDQTTPEHEVTHDYSVPGTFEARVNVLDDDGLSAAATATVTVCSPDLPTSGSQLPHGFAGAVTINGSPAADGTRITAIIGCQPVAEATVTGGKYRMVVGEPRGTFYAGKTITFTIGDSTAAQSTTWNRGNIDILNLTTSG